MTLQGTEVSVITATHRGTVMRPPLVAMHLWLEILETDTEEESDIHDMLLARARTVAAEPVRRPCSRDMTTDTI